MRVWLLHALRSHCVLSPSSSSSIVLTRSLVRYVSVGATRAMDDEPSPKRARLDTDNAATPSPPASLSTTVESPSSSQRVLTPEQLERMERNRLAALARRQERLQQQQLAAPSPPASPTKLPSTSTTTPSSSSSSTPTASPIRHRSYVDKNLIDELQAGTWRELLASQFASEYFAAIEEQLANDERSRITIYPPRNHVFEALNTCSYEDVKVVILGQDPYHAPSQAHGLSFSVRLGIDAPPSLVNIYKELQSDTALQPPFVPPPHGSLLAWAERGVLLLNASLTVRARSPGSHALIGWHMFTDTIIELVSRKSDAVVFLLWGKHAAAKRSLIRNAARHCILECAHPSPLSASKVCMPSHTSQSVSRVYLLH